jgi:tetrapyrrole methylase family protein/MazG family protein
MNRSSEALWKYFNSVQQMFRGEKACPWLKTQTHESLLPYLKEEIGEFISALRKWKDRKQSPKEAIDELGDLWLQSVLHLLLLSETSGLDLASILDGWTEKIRVRHPHVFDPQASQRSWTLEEVLQEWRRRKKTEKDTARKIKTLEPKVSDFREYAGTLSELVRSQKIGERSRIHNFDWSSANEVNLKIEEEFQELKSEMTEKIASQARLKEEIGDLLFSIAQLARHLGISSEEALAEANGKFINRFEEVERLFTLEHPEQAAGDWNSVSRELLENYWQRAKISLSSQGKTKT